MAVLAEIAVKAAVAKVAEIAVEADSEVPAVKAAVAVLAFPVNSPTKFVALIELNPDMLEKVPPKIAIVEPKVI